MQEKLREEIFSKYKIDINEIEFKNAPDLSIKEKEVIVYNLLAGYELAKNNKLTGNVTGSYYSCCIIDDELKPHFGVNFNATRNEISSICAERLALLETFLDKIKEFDSNKNNFNFKIKYILMSAYKNDNDITLQKVTPCVDCLSWFNIGYHLTSDTKFASLKKNEKGYYVYFQNLIDFLPLRNLEFTSVHPNDVNSVVNYTKEKIDETEIKKLYAKTYEALENNGLSKTSGQNTASGIIVNDEIFASGKIDFSKRWFIEPLEASFILAINKYGADTKVRAICYIGEEYTVTETGKKVKDGLISLKTLGRLLTKFATKDTLIITGAKNSIEIRTIADFLPGDCTFIQGYEIK